MTIKRTVNGVEMEFELTRAERWDAYEEAQHEFDKSDIDAVFDREEYGISESEADDLIDEMAYRICRQVKRRINAMRIDGQNGLVFHPEHGSVVGVPNLLGYADNRFFQFAGRCVGIFVKPLPNFDVKQRNAHDFIASPKHVKRVKQGGIFVLGGQP